MPLFQRQRRKATEGQPKLTEQRDQSRWQRGQPCGLWRWGCSVQWGWLLYRGVRWAKGKEGVPGDQSHHSDHSMRHRTAIHRSPDAPDVFIKPVGKNKSKREQTLFVPSTSLVSNVMRHCQLHTATSILQSSDFLSCKRKTITKFCVYIVYIVFAEFLFYDYYHSFVFWGFFFVCQLLHVHFGLYKCLLSTVHHYD